MRILRGIRMMMVRLITRVTCHCEMRATCFPEGGVPTKKTHNVEDHNMIDKFGFLHIPSCGVYIKD